MQIADKITKVTQLLLRVGGSEARIVAEVFLGGGLHESVSVYVLKRENSEQEWSLCNDRPHPDWLKMTVDDYAKKGRSEMLRTVTHTEILKVTSLLGQPLAVFTQSQSVANCARGYVVN